jgi:hypothetical protein
MGHVRRAKKKILEEKRAMRTLFFRQEKSFQDLWAAGGGRWGDSREAGRVGL